MHRSDGSGTTAVFTDYLSKVSPAWTREGRHRQRASAGRSASAPRATRASPARSRPRRAASATSSWPTPCRTSSRSWPLQNSAKRFVEPTLAEHQRPRRAVSTMPRRPPRLDHRRAGRERLSDLRLHLHPRLRGAAGPGQGRGAGAASSGGRSTTARSSAPALDYAPLPPPRSCSRVEAKLKALRSAGRAAAAADLSGDAASHVTF